MDDKSGDKSRLDTFVVEKFLGWATEQPLNTTEPPVVDRYWNPSVENHRDKLSTHPLGNWQAALNMQCLKINFSEGGTCYPAWN